MKNVAIIGAGAAGCFCAIELKRRHPDYSVVVYESATKPLAKVAVTGGGRCNLTNSFACCLDDRGRLTNLQTVYPRGDKLMRKMLGNFSHEDVWQWFENEGVRLVTQEDECVFPVSQDAMQIVNTLTFLMHRLGVVLKLRSRVGEIVPCAEGGYVLNPFDERYDAVVVTSGGSPKASGLSFLKNLELEMVQPVPSLFTFNIAGSQNGRLMGTVVEDVCVTLAGTRHKAEGPLLWTHWGVSGPAVLKLSSYSARELAASDYKGVLVVNWCGGRNENEVREMLQMLMKENDKKSVCNVYPDFLTQKHWAEILEYCSIPPTQRWGAVNNTHLNRLAACLTSQQLEITGRCHFKEEFVTCGGVSLSSVSAKTLEAKNHQGLFFAGEVLDVDAITGGFNLQAAWSMGYTCAMNM